MSSSERRLADFERRGSGISALLRELKRGVFPGAVLICGAAGMGKTTLSRLLAAALLCEEQDASARPCLRCRSCLRVSADTHPDLLTPADSKKKSIGVEEIRGILSALQSNALESDRRVVLIDDADRMTAQAQNSLLKNLEEHPPGTHFILTTAYENRVLSTIRSRVITVRLAPMAAEELCAWLMDQGLDQDSARLNARLSDGSPGAALALTADETDQRLRGLAYDSVFSVSAENEIPEAEYRLRDLKDDFDAFLKVLERELRLCVHGAADSRMPRQWLSAPPAGLARMLGAVVRAEQRRTSNVNYQAVLNVLLQDFVEELSAWRSS